MNPDEIGSIRLGKVLDVLALAVWLWLLLRAMPGAPQKKRTSDEVRFMTVKLWDSSAFKALF
jgi:hypothetical protein